MKIGILTFYCSNNYGAMLQAYALKTFVKSICNDTQIVPYAPFFLVGRHWFIPYCPLKPFSAMLRYTLSGLKNNLLTTGIDAFRQIRRMHDFRRKYLCDNFHVIRSIKGLESLPFDTYIVGSDQIWNPEITMGLRPAYFGAFPGKNKKQVIAYAASLGGEKIALKYQDEMRTLLTNVDQISLREASAIPFIQNLTGRTATAVADPVFLLEKNQWETMVSPPTENHYILVHVTEKNNKLEDYAAQLSTEKHLPVIQLKYRKDRKRDNKNFQIVTDAGPLEFLGYVRHADYVLTNSFHVLAFSIIFQKNFLVFGHSSRNARLENLLTYCTLNERMVQSGQEKIDKPISWNMIAQRINQMKKESSSFLLHSLN